VKCNVLRYTDLFVLNGIRGNFHSSGRKLLIYKFIKRIIGMNLIISEDSLSYQLPTKFSPTLYWPG
jgi:hypothetical protein